MNSSQVTATRSAVPLEIRAGISSIAVGEQCSHEGFTIIAVFSVHEREKALAFARDNDYTLRFRVSAPTE